MSRLKLDSFEIVAYRGLREMRFDGLRRFNLLFGPNNSGKTSALEAIGICCRPADLEQWLRTTYLRDPGAIDENRLISLRWCFANVRTSQLEEESESREPLYEGEIELRAGGTLKIKSVRASYRELMAELTEKQRQRFLRRQRRTPDELGPLFHRGAEILVETTQRSDESIDSTTLTVWEDEPTFLEAGGRHAGAAVQMLSSSTYHAGQLLVKLVHQLQFDECHDTAIRAMQEFDRDIEGLEVGSSRGYRPGVYIRHARLGVVPLSAFGDGMRRAVTLLLGAFAAANGVLLLDEIESGIHYSALSPVLRLLMHVSEQFDVQVFATTHSLDAIDAAVAAQERLNDVVAYRLPERGSQQVLAAFPGESLHELRYEGGKEVR
jgi:predicted ATP-dependent endonuclease of OLD family